MTKHFEPRPLTRDALRKMGIDSGAARAVVKGKPMSGAVPAPAVEFPAVFDYQSYFDDALAEKALFRQQPGQAIVESTRPSEPIQQAGYGIALHPSSQTPVAVQFETGAQQGRSPTYHLKPGQVVRPQGLGPDGGAGYFTGFTWGLPFGWLGGGSATLILLRSPDAEVHWTTEHSEIVFHRIRLEILTPAELEAAGGVYTGPLNWPTRFPWPFAQFGTNALTQRGQPVLAVTPTATEMSLRLATVTLGAPPDDGVFRIYFIGSDPWAQSGPNAQGKGSISLADVRAVDQIWGTWAQQAAAPAPFNSAFQTLTLQGDAVRYAANAGAVQLASLDPQLQGEFVDIVRYGYL